MRIRLLNVLLVAALALAVSRLWQFLGEPPVSLPAPPAQDAAPAAPEREPAAETAEPRPEEYEVIVARDLFSPTRGVVPPAPVSPPRPAAVQQAPKLTLYGVVIVDGEKTAFLQEGPQEGRPRKIRENESFAGGVLKSIRPDGVTFLFAGTEISVPLRTPKVDAGAPPARGLDAGSQPQRAMAPAAVQRRQLPAGVPQMPIPAQGRVLPSPPGMPTTAPPPAEPGNEVFGNEEFPMGTMPGEEAPEFTPDEAPE